jgi:hypothetical protein
MRFHRLIAGGHGITTKNEMEDSPVTFFYSDNSVRYNIPAQAVQNDVPLLNRSRWYRIDRDHIPMANCRVHACSRGPEAHTNAATQELGAELTNLMGTTR